jgi:arylsulfatase A-like enzyme
LDLYPTIVDYAGGTVPKELDGRSLRPLLNTPTAIWDKPAISQVFHGPKAQGFSIRTRRWRYALALTECLNRYLIREKSTGSVLFLGRMTQPNN